MLNNLAYKFLKKKKKKKTTYLIRFELLNCKCNTYHEEYQTNIWCLYARFVKINWKLSLTSCAERKRVEYNAISPMNEPCFSPFVTLCFARLGNEPNWSSSSLLTSLYYCALHPTTIYSVFFFFFFFNYYIFLLTF